MANNQIIQKGIAGKSSSHCIAYYVDHFLDNTLTFIYRQLIGVADELPAIVLTSRRMNETLFPFERVYEKRQTRIQKAVLKLKRRITGRYSNISRFQLGYWIRALVQNDAALIHAQFGPGGLKMLPVAKALDIPLIVTFRGQDATRLPRIAEYREALEGLFRYSKILTVSRSIAGCLIVLGAPSDRVKVHYNGIPVEDFPFVPRIPVSDKIRARQEIVFLQVSSFVEKKGHEYTVRVFKRILGEYPMCKLIFAGEGRLRNDIGRMCTNLGIDERVTFLGSVPRQDIFPLMRNADVLLQHSITATNGDQEGIPNVVLEAMATGLPVISTNHSGIPEVIQDGVDGFLVQEKDEVGYAKRILELFQSDANISSAAREKVCSKFNLKLQNGKLKEIYLQLLK